MKLIVGLGNPGKKCANNKHNLGFMVLNEFARSEGLAWHYNPDWITYFVKSRKQPAVASNVARSVTDYVLLKPATFMNKSGIAVKSVADFFKILKEDILVVHDDLDLPFGKIRLSFDSLSAGHKGLDSIIENLSGFNFGRLRIGIGKPQQKSDTEKYVLSDFSIEEQKQLAKIIKISKEALKSYMADGIQATMNRFN